MRLSHRVSISRPKFSYRLFGKTGKTSESSGKAKSSAPYEIRNGEDCTSAPNNIFHFVRLDDSVELSAECFKEAILPQDRRANTSPASFEHL